METWKITFLLSYLKSWLIKNYSDFLFHCVALKNIFFSYLEIFLINCFLYFKKYFYFYLFRVIFFRVRIQRAMNENWNVLRVVILFWYFFFFSLLIDTADKTRIRKRTLKTWLCSLVIKREKLSLRESGKCIFQQKSWKRENHWISHVSFGFVSERMVKI